MARLDLERLVRAYFKPGRVEPRQTADFEDTQRMGMSNDVDERVWHQSSFELKRGLDITEQPLDTLPGELRALFRRR